MYYKFLILSVLALALGAMARPNSHARAVDLADVVNKTVCPIVVEIDENPERIPRKIKMLKCAPEPNLLCLERRIPRHECCGHSHHAHVMECVEIRDTVVVFDKRQQKSLTLEVSVGCTCMIEQSTLAPELEHSPP